MKENKGLSLSTLSLAAFQLPLRPGHGVKGKVVHLRTNYFKMTINAGKKLFKYNLTLTAKRKEPVKNSKPPAIPLERSRKRRQALALLFQEPDFRSMDHGVATDYGSIIITSKELPLDGEETKEYAIVYREVEDREPASNPIIYTFKLTYGGLIPTTELLRYLASTTTDPSDFRGKDDAIQALNIIVARTPNFNPGVFQSGTNKFFHYPTDPNTYDNLGNGLIAVRGYYSSVRTSTLRTLLNVNAQTSPFYPAISVPELIARHGGMEHNWLAIESFIRLLRVKTKYMKHKDGTEAVKVKTILGLSEKWDDVVDKKGNVVIDEKGKVKKIRDTKVRPLGAQKTSFRCEELGNQDITVEQYFKKKYNITLEIPQAWVLNCGTTENPIWIPPELCEVMPGQAYRGKLSDLQTDQMKLVAARGPGENARRIANGACRVIGFQGNNPTLTAFGVGVDSRMLVIKGRILPPPPVTYRAKSQIVPIGASWNMRGKQFATSPKLMKWSFLKLGGTRLQKEHVDLFRKTLKDYGIDSDGPSNPPGFDAALPSPENDDSIKNIFRDMSKLGIKIVLVILPRKCAATYARVKYWGDVRTGIHSVCVLAQKLQKGPQYYANVALKINLKMGGANQLLPQQLGFLNDENTMVVGIDVTHPAPKSMAETPSIAAVVASIDNHYAQWPGSIRCQKSKQEMVSTLNLMMQERLRLWNTKNERRWPAKILIYRDGVSEGQYKTVLEEELTQIRLVIFSDPLAPFHHVLEAGDLFRLLRHVL